MLWFHGGGYIFGKPMLEDAICREFADRLGITVAAAKYRLAPEHPYPAELDDAHAALTWLADQPTVDPTQIAIGGASARGGLAAALAIRVRDAGETAPVRQLLIYPKLDDRSGRRPGLDSRDFRLVNEKVVEYSWRCYRGAAVPNIAVPARKPDLSGVAPAWIDVGALDLFRDESNSYAAHLVGVGVPCDLHIVPGAFHAFDRMAPKAAITKTFFDRQCSAVDAAIS